MIIVNFKAYREAVGKEAVKLAKLCEQVSRETGISIVPAVQASDIRSVAENSIPVFAQHVDAAGYGAHTGAVLAEAAKEAGASGSLINHSERRLADTEVSYAVERLKTLGMVAVVCAASDEEGAKLAACRPDYIAVEPPELIGGDISVSTAKPGLIRSAVKKIPCSVLVGAGIKNGEDVRVARRLGAKGVLVASGVVKAKNQEKALRDLAAGF